MTRKEAIKELKYIRESFAVNEFSDEAMDMAIEALQERKTGKWMQTVTMNIFECSCCHSRWNVYYVCDFDYCPHCGCKMEVEE